MPPLAARHQSSFFSLFFRVLIAATLIAVANQAHAFTFTVSSLSNSGTGTLRQALGFVNNGDSVIFSVTGTINITSELSCTKAVHIIGPGSGSLTIDAGDNSRVFNLNTVGSLYIEGLTIQEGNISPGSGLEGGGIYAIVDQLYLTDVAISNNNIGSQQSNGQPNVKGGGAYIESDLLVLDNVVVNGNVSRGRPTAFGGGLYVVSDEVRMFNTNIYSNGVVTDQYVGSATSTGGGAYLDADSIYLEHCNINNNSLSATSGWQTYNGATTRGGGLYTTNSSSSVNEFILQNVNIYANNSNSNGNYSYPYAGGWYGEHHDIKADSVNMYENRISMYDWYDGNGRAYCMYLTGISSFEMTNSTIYDHEENRNGYDHHVVYISASGDITFGHLKAYNNDIQANYSQSIFKLSGNNGMITNAEFYDNNTFSSGTMDMLETDFTNAMDIEQSSFYENDRTIIVSGGDLNLTNCTMADNSQDIYSTNTASTINLVNSTVYGTITAPDMEFENTILFAPSLAGTITTNGGNIINSPSYGSSFTQGSDLNNVNPVLDTLDYHGGTTKVYSVFPFSQAINNGVSNGITVDQRGYTRNGNVDIGAFEFNGTDPNICSTVNVIQTASACSSYSWTDGNTYTSSTTAPKDTLTSTGGCDSIVTLHLTIHQPDASTHTVQACGSYTWIDGNTYTSNNSTATYTLQNQYGCDSVITLNLTMAQGSLHTQSVSACESYTWINGQTYTASTNSVTYTVPASGGCDSIITLDLTITNNVHQTQFISACGSYTWIDGNTYASSNSTATYTLSASNGCDSILHLNLMISSTSSGTDVVTSCGSYTWIDGNTYNGSNSTATHTLTGSNGCDSVVTLNLTVLNATSSTDAIVACGSHSWIDGNTYTSSNSTATHIIPNAQGCDSVITLNLTINIDVNQTQFISACGSYTWIDGNTYTSSNSTATYTLPSTNGCDSILHLSLTILNTSSSTDVISACGSYTWINGNTYTASNSTATHTLTGSNGCDSVVTLNLTILNATSSTDAIVACESYTWIDGNTYTSSNSTATHTIPNGQGCDSVITLNLTINNSVNQTQFITACGSYTWIDGNTYSASNSSASHTLTRSNGCDSVLHLNLTLLNASASIDVVNTCDSYLWIDGNTYTSSTNSPTITLLNSVGCDSVITLNLTIRQSSSSIDTLEACESYTWINGKTYNTSNNTATHTVFNANSCDSVIHLNLTIHEAKSSMIDTLIFEGDTVKVGTSQYTEEGVYTDDFTTVHGCDSVVTTIIYTEPNGVAELNEATVSIFPNPTRGMFTMTGTWRGEDAQVRILNVSGQSVYSFQSGTRNLNQQVDLTTYPSGVYFIEMTDQGQRSVQRIVKVQ